MGGLFFVSLSIALLPISPSLSLPLQYWGFHGPLASAVRELQIQESERPSPPHTHTHTHTLMHPWILQKNTKSPYAHKDTQSHSALSLSVSLSLSLYLVPLKRANPSPCF